MKIPKITLEKNFLLFSILFGLICLILLPPFQAPDESGHFMRSYMIAEGKLMCENADGSNSGSYMPKSLKELPSMLESAKIIFHPEVKQNIDLIKKALKLPVTNKREFVEFPTSCVYSPVTYLPQSLGILIGKLVNSSALVLFYLGRLFNLIFYVAICFIAIKIIPRFKGTLALLALTPMAIHQAASLSADGITISSSFLLVSYIIYLASQEKISNKQLVLLTILGSIVSLSKIVYFPLVWLYFIIPSKLIGSKKRYFITGLTISGISLFTFGFWMFIIRTIQVIFPVDPKAQLLIILSHPLSFTYKLFYTLFTMAHTYFLQFFGEFGWLDTPMPTLLAVGFLIALTISSFIYEKAELAEQNDKTNLIKGLWILFIFIVIVVLIHVTLFLNFSKPDLKVIQGVQGRYFIPIAFLFFCSLNYLRSSIQKYWNQIIFIGAIIMFVLCSYFLFIRYYV